MILGDCINPTCSNYDTCRNKPCLLIHALNYCSVADGDDPLFCICISRRIQKREVDMPDVEWANF
jgi:hypothetical protein